jgi:uncharacterized protein YndB with AHSA1/START domain
MTNNEKNIITIQVIVSLPAEKVWKLWTTPEDIVKWNAASDDWHTTLAENDLRPGGNFKSRMEAKDGSTGFDFGGVYDKVSYPVEIFYTIGDGRKVKIFFNEAYGKTTIVQSFEAESIHSAEMQRNGWQSILNNFRKYAESNH